MQTGTTAPTERIDISLGPITVLRHKGEVEAVVRVDMGTTDDLQFYWDLFLEIMLQINPRVTSMMLDDPDYDVDDLFFWVIVL
jgi:hypothetical protein